MENGSALSIRNISKSFVTKKSALNVVNNVSLDVYRNEFLVLLGPGQCGKSVILNMLAGLEKPTVGEIYLNGQPHSGIDKRIAMVFQKLALLPWLTVSKNVQLGLKYSNIPQKEREEISAKYIKLVGLTGFENHYPHQLSGGMKQRVGIARAYANSPEVLLMDEPFGQLDAQTRYSMHDEILKIWEQEKRTIVFVTNNIEEALYLADRIVLFSKQPATVKAEFDLSKLGRPRSYTSDEFLRMREELTELMELDIKR
ncbi:ATP-binding cassette domain-containing protein [Clostridium sp. MCC353]|uniref:ABC transporter ATP-binding protein n=1 Tax=Clostridium sp. MCC353 TaxID=2592646 RepID=UPI001C02ED75|nr:ABC transporter ATP-binding protein [Clostridium sp. MCC353]MBT9775520.1 ATP-binding cassette domain-containing protein [Clostridium sp. MCC353]